jgi:hypothetical protein
MTASYNLISNSIIQQFSTTQSEIFRAPFNDTQVNMENVLPKFSTHTSQPAPVSGLPKA